MPTLLPPEISRDKAFAEKYLIEHDLGMGGAGIVVGARHRELDERVAIKFLLPGQSHEAVARFRREARAASRIKNQHVVRIFDVSTTDSGVPYIVMEYLDGVDLERMLQQMPKRQLLILDAIEFILQACEALAECHGLGIVHRDLKPSNLFCVHGADGLPLIKVLDFGISKLMVTTVEGDTTDHSRLLGSPRYMSPEQFDSSVDVDSRTDIWAIGVILYELFTGTVPFVETDVLKLWQKIRSEPPPPVTLLRSEVPAPLVAVILKCLEKNRLRRYANLAELAKALLPFAPERARASVTRIVRTIQSPGTMTSALDLPTRLDSSGSHSPTIHSITPQRIVPAKSTPPLIGAAAAIVAVAVAALWASRADRPAVALTPALASAPTAQIPTTPPAAPATTSVVAASEPLSTTASDAGKTTATAVTATLLRPKVPPRAPASAGASPNWPASAASVVPVPLAQPSAAATTAATPAATVAPVATSPWIVDIVEQRKSVP